MSSHLGAISVGFCTWALAWRCLDGMRYCESRVHTNVVYGDELVWPLLPVFYCDDKQVDYSEEHFQNVAQ
jgi:hypothetical protein